MRLVSHNLEDLMIKVKRRHTDIYLMLTEFLNGNDDCVKIEDWTHKNASCCAVSVARSARHYYPNQIKVIQQGGDVYLVKLVAMK